MSNEKTLIKSYWTIIGPNKRMVLAKCICGNERTIRRSFIKNGQSRSCGCLMPQLVVKSRIRNGTGHGDRRSRLYSIWSSMLTRARNKKRDRAKDYVNRGIKVCNEWGKYQNFKSWAMQNNYSDELSIDRIDNDGNYEPKNCRFSTSLIQSNNKRNTRYICYLGKNIPRAEFCRITGLGYSYVRWKQDLNDMPGEEILQAFNMLKSKRPDE